MVLSECGVAVNSYIWPQNRPTNVLDPHGLQGQLHTCSVAPAPGQQGGGPAAAEGHPECHFFHQGFPELPEDPMGWRCRCPEAGEAQWCCKCPYPESFPPSEDGPPPPNIKPRIGLLMQKEAWVSKLECDCGAEEAGCNCEVTLRQQTPGWVKHWQMEVEGECYQCGDPEPEDGGGDGETPKPTLCFTFDDSPWGFEGEITTNVIGVLNEADVDATFFPIGEHISRNVPVGRAVITLMRTTGHLVGNHSYSHWHEEEPYHSAAEFLEDFIRADPWIRYFREARPGERVPPIRLTRIPGRQPNERPDITQALEADGRAVAGWKLNLTLPDHPVRDLSATELVAIIAEAATRQGNLTILLHDKEWDTDVQKRKLAEVIAALKGDRYPFARLTRQGTKVTCAGARTY